MNDQTDSKAQFHLSAKSAMGALGAAWLCGLAFILASFCGTSPAVAQTTYTWDGGTNGTGNFWTTAANWAPDGTPPSASTTNLFFQSQSKGGVLTSPLDLNASWTVGLITFDNSDAELPSTLNINTDSAGISAQTLTIFTGITLQNTSTQVSFAGGVDTMTIILGANNVFTTSTGSYLQINSGVVITDPTASSFGITVAGGGAVGLNAPNTFKGGVTVNSGATLRVGTTTQSTDTSSTVSGGVLISSQLGLGTLTLQDGSTIVSGGSGDRTLQNNLSLSGSVTFGATSTFTGTFTFNSGTSPNTLTTPATIALTASTTLTTNVSTTLDNAISGGTFSLSKLGSAPLILSAINSYSGGTIVGAGTFEIGVDGSMGSGPVTLGSVGGGNATLTNFLGGHSFSNNITVVAGSTGTLSLSYTSGSSFNSTFSGTITLNDNLTLQSSSVAGFSMILSGAISGSNGLTKTGTGTVTLSNANAGYSGTITISTGTLQIGTTSTGTTGGAGTASIVDNATLSINRTNSYAMSNAISGSGAVTQAGSGTTTLSNTNSYQGATNVTNGKLIVSGNLSGTTQVNIAGGTLQLGASNVINPAATLTLATGVLNTGGFDLGSPTTPGLGDLTVSATSTIDFGSGSASQLLFAGLGTHTAGAVLQLIDWNWNGSLITGGGVTDDRLMFAGLASAFTGTYAQSEVSFNGIAGYQTVQFDPTHYEIVAIPEPGTGGLLLSVGLLGLVRRRRDRRFRSC